MSSSILTSTKKILGIAEDYTAFDMDIMMHINTVFPILGQLGIGPVNGFMILDKNATWDDFLGEDLNLNSVKTYVYLRVRLLFDPPSTSYHITAIEKQIEELGWRISSHREATQWADPIPHTIDLEEDPFETVIVDGGSL